MFKKQNILIQEPNQPVFDIFSEIFDEFIYEDFVCDDELIQLDNNTELNNTYEYDIDLEMKHIKENYLSDDYKHLQSTIETINEEFTICENKLYESTQNNSELKNKLKDLYFWKVKQIFHVLDNFKQNNILLKKIHIKKTKSIRNNLCNYN